MKTKAQQYTIKSMLIAIAIGSLPFTVTSCLSPVDRAEIRQESRVDNRVDNRMDRRHDRRHDR